MILESFFSDPVKLFSFDKAYLPGNSFDVRLARGRENSFGIKGGKEREKREIACFPISFISLCRGVILIPTKRAKFHEGWISLQL
mmetsp:Transcript_30504/g.34674  ORF Transcript_30504/g.34674 Transcript_30504/m.34674 type:complete len:85 (+) Transcript_30504:373-627(+)